MFGYVTVCEPELKVKDLKKYRAYYCGLCRTLKEDYGFMGQMTLTYDMTFAVILLSSLYERIPELEKHRCKILSASVITDIDTVYFSIQIRGLEKSTDISDQNTENPFHTISFPPDLILLIFHHFFPE